jgi:hypothetical protein
MLRDVAISGDRNVIKKETEKILKYKNLTVVIQRMCNVGGKMMPVLRGANGTVSNSFRKYTSNMTGKARNQGTTVSSHIGHCTHTAESTDVKVQNI